MRWISCAAKAVLASLIFAGAAQAAEIKVISSDGFALVLDALKSEFEKASGNKLVIRYDVANVLQKDLLEGAPFDVVISTDEVMSAIGPVGKFVPATRVALARSGIGIAYKAGTPRPNIHDAASFRSALVEAPSIAYLPAGSTGAHVNSVATKLGILDQLKAKAVVLESSSRDASSAAGAAGQNTVLQAVLDGKARFGIQAISNILPVPGLEWVAFTVEFQQFRSYSGAVGTASNQAGAGTALLKFLTAPKNEQLMKSKGMEPG